jgi:hypothetical protein
VFAEICAGIDRRNTVQRHIHQHIDDFIAVKVKWHEDRLIDLSYRARPSSTGNDIGQELYVDPRSGLIRINKDYRSWRRRNAERARARDAEIAAQRRVLDAKTMLLRLNGGWFWVEVDTLPAWSARDVVIDGEQRRSRHAEPRFDVVLKRETSRAACKDAPLRARLYGRDDLYGLSKRQISRREMKQFGVERSL